MRRSDLVPFNPLAVSPKYLENLYTETPKSRIERINVRNIKLMLSDIDKKVSDSLGPGKNKKV